MTHYLAKERLHTILAMLQMKDNNLFLQLSAVLLLYNLTNLE